MKNRLNVAQKAVYQYQSEFNLLNNCFIAYYMKNSHLRRGSSAT